VLGIGGIICLACPVNTCFGGSGYIVAGGTASAGALGGRGGSGGGGAGGSSYAIVTIGAGIVVRGGDTLLTHGHSGTGGNGANAGSNGTEGDALE
jgi:hypothetical protein